MKTKNFTHDVEALSMRVMRGVVATGAVSATNMDRAVEVMRAEIKALLTDPRYAAQRQAVMDRRVSEGTVVATVVATCAARIAGVPGA